MFNKKSVSLYNVTISDDVIGVNLSKRNIPLNIDELMIKCKFGLPILRVVHTGTDSNTKNYSADYNLAECYTKDETVYMSFYNSYKSEDVYTDVLTFAYNTANDSCFITLDSISITQKPSMEYYVVTLETIDGVMHITKDGVIQSYDMLKNAFDHPNLFLYLTYNHHIYIPSMDLSAGMLFDNTSIYREDDDLMYPEHDRVLITTSNVVSTVHLTAQTRSNMFYTLEDIDDMSEDELSSYYPSASVIKQIKELP